ncbi:MAG: hypothetical protein H6712_10740 [Myxococcales bacterium]|nr:hypothetical protein [Myxococcales bacterium]MCB9714326.1 hypothetical protein [Myxococcales bacterium]
MRFSEALREQRWDDHRFYHHSRINQSLHMLSACCFLASYVMIFVDPVVAVMLGWTLAMISRQIGHFFFEPKGYDEVNGATHEHKEAIKVGYNLRRKTMLLSVWGLSLIALVLDPTLLGLLPAPTSTYAFLTNLSILWAMVAAGAMVVRTVHLFFLQGVQAGLVWFVKILTDPFHDLKIYYKSPLHLLRGEKLDPMEPWPAA